MLPVEVDMPTWSYSHFNKEENEVGLRCSIDLVDKIRDIAHIWEFVAKWRATRRYNSKVIQIEMREGELVLQ